MIVDRLGRWRPLWRAGKRHVAENALDEACVLIGAHFFGEPILLVPLDIGLGD